MDPSARIQLNSQDMHGRDISRGRSRVFLLSLTLSPFWRVPECACFLHSQNINTINTINTIINMQELKWVVERTLGSSQEDEVLAEAAAKLQVGAMGGGADWGNAPSSSHPRRKSGTDGSRRGSGGGGGGGGGEGGGEGDGGAADGETSAPDDLGIGEGKRVVGCGLMSHVFVIVYLLCP